MGNQNQPRPNPWQYLRYCYGGRLPDSMRDWVAEDVTGKGAIARLMVRMVIPAFLILLPFWFIPASFVVHLSMTVPILIPFIYFSHSQNKVWRRHVLRKHGLDPSMVDQRDREKRAHVHDSYIERFGPRDPNSTGTHDI